MKLSILIGLMPLFYSVANAAAIKEPHTHKGYFVTPWYTPPLGWEVEVDRNKTITVRGTLEDVRPEALKHNPNWERDYPPVAIDYDDDDQDVERDVTSASDSNVHKRSVNVKRAAQDFHAAQIDCGRGESAEWMTALHRVQYLYGVKGKPTNGPGKGACTRVSCSENTAVLWCNDDPYTKSLTSFRQIADGGMAILNQCYTNPFGGAKMVSGQAFHKNNWNVIVRHEAC